MDNVRIIAGFNLTDFFTQVDASYAVHPNMRIHTGEVMSMGYRIFNCKQKISTEAELIGTVEYVSFNEWMVMFMEAQGYEIKNNILFQDNQSTIRISNNGRYSCTGNSRNFNIRHLFVKVRVDKG